MATRRERVVLELEDNFTTGMARAAASAALLNRELNSLSKDSVRTQRSFSDIDRASSSMGREASSAGKEVEGLTGRMGALVDAAILLGPALVPIGALAIPAITGLAAQLGFAAAAGGTAILAFQGIGNTLKLMNKAAVEPTKENIQAATVALENLSPAAQKFAKELRSLSPEMKHLRDIAATGLFPGVVEGLQSMQTALPRVSAVVTAVSTELGHIAADTGKSLSSDRWLPFLDFIAKEAPHALADMATAAGHTGHALAELWMASEPLNRDFSKWLVDATADLDRWAAGLSKTKSFNDFVAFVEEHGPQVAATFGAIGNAVLQVVEAAAPLSGPVLQTVEALANALAGLANSDIGTPLFTAAAAMTLFNRAMRLATSGRDGLGGFQTRLNAASTKVKGFGTSLQGVREDLVLMSTTALTAGARTEREMLRINAASARLKASLSPLGKGAALFAGLAVASTGAADGIGLTNTASLALLGTLIPGGVVAGGLVGGLLDAKAASQDFASAIDGANKALASTDSTQMQKALDALKKARDDAQHHTGVKDFFGDVSTQIRSNPIPLPIAFGGGGNDPVSKAQSKVDSLKKALNFQTAADRAKADLDFMGQGFQATSTGLDAATQSAQDFKNSLDKINQALTGRATFRDYEAALDDFAKRAAKRAELRAKILEAESGVSQAKANLAAAKTPAQKQSATNSLKTAEENVKSLRKELEGYKATLDTTTQAGRDEQAALDAIASSAINYAKTIQDPALRAAFLKNARQEFIKAEVAAGASKDAAKALADQVGLLNGVKGKVKIVVDANGAVRVISETELALERLQRKLNAVTAKNKIAAMNSARGFATGGWTGPGSKYQPAGVVHADEYVFSKEATNGNVAYLDSLHRQLRGYADGGLVQRFQSSPRPVVVNTGGGLVNLSAGDINQLAQAMSAVRPLYGDVSISGDPTVFRQQLQRDKRASSADGVRR